MEVPIVREFVRCTSEHMWCGTMMVLFILFAEKIVRKGDLNDYGTDIIPYSSVLEFALAYNSLSFFLNMM